MREILAEGEEGEGTREGLEKRTQRGGSASSHGNISTGLWEIFSSVSSSEPQKERESVRKMRQQDEQIIERPPLSPPSLCL
jgi:hypothetical protein